MSALEPNNKAYSDYAEQLINKAEIAGSFQDSPCETGKQRLEGVKRRIFVRAVDELSFRYISKIDYREMASKGIRRCRLLADVVGTLTKAEDGRQKTEDRAGSGGKTKVEHPTSNIEQRTQKTEGDGQEPNTAALGESFKDFKPDANAIADVWFGRWFRWKMK